jgi:RNA polymerase sigma-70 factor (ECF subfamily)
MNDQPASSTIGEPDLVRQAQQGDREAFGELVRCHRQGVVNLAYRLCGEAPLAEDIAQEAFVRAWQNLTKYQPRAPFRNWLYRIAANLMMDALRSEREAVDIESLPLASPSADPESALIGKERARQVQAAVLGLPPASRAVLVLREYERLSYQEIADALSLPLGTVMSRLSYARKCLLAALAPEMERA